MREAGWYWVLWPDGAWEPLEWWVSDAIPGVANWTNGEFTFNDGDFTEIDERRIVRGE